MRRILPVLLFLLLCAPAQAQSKAAIEKAKPSTAETNRIRNLQPAELRSLIGTHTHIKIEISGCELVYEFTHQQTLQTFGVRIDLRYVAEGGWEFDRPNLLYHPHTKGKYIKVFEKGQNVLTTEFTTEWHSIRVKGNNPRGYWQTKLAFEALAKKTAQACG